MRLATNAITICEGGTDTGCRGVSTAISQEQAPSPGEDAQRRSTAAEICRGAATMSCSEERCGRRDQSRGRGCRDPSGGHGYRDPLGGVAAETHRRGIAMCAAVAGAGRPICRRHRCGPPRARRSVWWRPWATAAGWAGSCPFSSLSGRRGGDRQPWRQRRERRMGDG
jgi:hypothetical protein